MATKTAKPRCAFCSKLARVEIRATNADTGKGYAPVSACSKAQHLERARRYMKSRPAVSNLRERLL